MAELESQPKSIQSLYGWFGEEKLFVNRRYQRKLVWTLEEKQKLIESILKKYPIPAIFLAERPDGTYEIIDGLQRLHTIMSFIENAFPTESGRYFDVDYFPTAKERANSGKFTLDANGARLTSREISTILDYILAVSVMRGASEAEIDDVFGRINTYGHRLSEQERRQAGAQDGFSNIVRVLSSHLRGEETNDILGLEQMPSISIDLPKTKHGYQVQADQTLWVSQGILRSTGLRDSMDEQCVADILACVAGARLIQRSKEALDAIYTDGDSENLRVNNALSVYGAERLQDEIKYCIDEIISVTNSGTPQTLRDILFTRRTNNAFSALFAAIVIAFHEVLIGQKKKIQDYGAVKRALTGLDSRIDTGRGSTTVSERRKNVDSVKGLLSSHVVDGDLTVVYQNHSATDIDNAILRSEIELPAYELKQGLLSLSDSREVDDNVIAKVVKSVCAIANNGPGRSGTIIIGVSDKPADTARIENLDNISPRAVNRRSVVGVRREIKVLGETAEQYYGRWKNGIKNSTLSSPLKEEVLSNLDYHEYYGYGLIVISIPPQNAVSYVGDDLYMRSGDDTLQVTDAKSIAGLIGRFS